MAQASQFRLVGYDAVSDEAIEADGKGHQSRNAWHGLGRRVEAGLRLPLTQFSATAAPRDMKLAVDGDGFVHSLFFDSLFSPVSVLIPLGRKLIDISPVAPW